MDGSLPEILCFVPHWTPRVAYVAHIAFNVFNTVPYRLVHSREEFLAYSGPKVNYSDASLAGPEKEVFIPASGLLFETGCNTTKPVRANGPGIPGFFPADISGADFSFDLFASVFFWLSRYEEYQPFSADRLGRFPASESLAFNNGLLDIPVVNHWLNALYDAIEAKWENLRLSRGCYRFLPTYDIDIAWAYLHRPWWRQAAALAKALALRQTAGLAARAATWKGGRDPYDQYDFLDTLHSPSDIKPLFFFLLGNYSKYDRNISHRSPALQKLIKRYREVAGLHPSVASNHKPGRLAEEKQRLEHITGLPATNTRQHYLLLSLPLTYRNLEAEGFKIDYSMGFADAPGFRAGTGTAFPWYDLPAERQSTLWVQPFQVMEVTLRDYLGLKPVAAAERILPILGQCKAAGTTFCTLWHNSSFSEVEGWLEWKEMYTGLLEAANNFFSLQKNP